MLLTRCLMIVAVCSTILYSSQKAEAFSIWCEAQYEIDKISCTYRYDFDTQSWIGCRQQAMQDIHSCYASVST